ncbi:MAG: hypothetical protein UY92_C0008G0013 [Candidatus Magasanikbacteria bacterium GW2011_GWA2_56_11]|uniref:Uncharacterized protein n=1 Tax=Candidatus Magasanikbacteria bacterium GW2011_GWA2_56_11 TaxID=1619044 RepID=A0A0G2ALX0_9BACT|nr:MAG: hypothetical protein UY92_C0008G0013 [Candidatus Magasanikbacteria bacterium GW2011_GWA2_56_11]
MFEALNQNRALRIAPRQKTACPVAHACLEFSPFPGLQKTRLADFYGTNV